METNCTTNKTLISCDNLLETATKLIINCNMLYSSLTGTSEWSKLDCWNESYIFCIMKYYSVNMHVIYLWASVTITFYNINYTNRHVFFVWKLHEKIKYLFIPFVDSYNRVAVFSASFWVRLWLNCIKRRTANDSPAPYTRP